MDAVMLAQSTPRHIFAYQALHKHMQLKGGDIVIIYTLCKVKGCHNDGPVHCPGLPILSQRSGVTSCIKTYCRGRKFSTTIEVLAP